MNDNVGLMLLGISNYEACDQNIAEARKSPREKCWILVLIIKVNLDNIFERTIFMNFLVLFKWVADLYTYQLET